MQVPRPVVPAVLLVVAMVVVPLAGVVLANAARPVIAAEPARPSPDDSIGLQVPKPPTTVRPLSTWFEPLLSSTLTRRRPLGRSSPAIEPFRSAMSQPRPSSSMSPSASSGASIRAARRQGPCACTDRRPARIRPGTRRPRRRDPTPAPSVFDTPGFRALSAKAMGAIATTPSNAAAVNDLAVAIAMTALADPTLFSIGPVGGSAQLREGALGCWSLASRHSRATGR